ncbi:MAG: glycoside hydrolase family 2 TIM barrel-domain containing protein [Terracidiphilus sp.]
MAKRATQQPISRRKFVQACSATAALTPMAACLDWATPEAWGAQSSGPAQRVLTLDRDWLFAGKSTAAALDPGYVDKSAARVTLPHTVADLSWREWSRAAWEDLFVYRRHFTVPDAWHGLRLFLHFDRVMASATPVVNGHSLEPHAGGFLPFDREITGLTTKKDNVLAVAVDSRWLNVPPAGSPRGAVAVDYLLPGGITGSVELRALPAIFISEVFARPVDVLEHTRHVEITCRVDAATPLPAKVRLEATLRRGEQTIARSTQSVQMDKSDQEFHLTLNNLGNVQLWDSEHPHLYRVEVTLFLDERPIHRSATRIGFREARFAIDGFFLNGQRTRLFGLNRHELYPYLGFAAPPRLLRRDAEILRKQFNCNIVRCSHYPQSEAFLDACDELGLMVWQEPPGWQYIGDESWKDLTVRDVEAMIRRDRNHAAIVIWGVRINESHNDPALYRRTRELAKSLDDSRPTSGTMTPDSRKNWQQEWHQDVFAFDDYHAAPDHSVGILDPVEGYPYLITETVGQFNYASGKGFAVRYRRAGDIVQQTSQAIYHAQAHSRVADHERIAGTIAWCAFDYASLMNDYEGIKCPGVADVFRLPKLGAAFYLAQVEPSVRPVIEPSFYWDFGPQTPSGPGEHAAIFSNCERLELFIDSKPHATLNPDRKNFANLRFPPSFADLKLDGSAHPELRIDGYVGNKRVLTRSFSSDHATDRFWLHADDAELANDGSDGTRLAFAVVDKFGAPRAFAGGGVALDLDGPGVIVGDNPFPLEPNGGAGAVYIRTVPGRVGSIRIRARHSALGAGTAEIRVRPQET